MSIDWLDQSTAASCPREWAVIVLSSRTLNPKPQQQPRQYIIQPFDLRIPQFDEPQSMLRVDTLFHGHAVAVLGVGFHAPELDVDAVAAAEVEVAVAFLPDRQLTCHAPFACREGNALCPARQHEPEALATDFKGGRVIRRQRVRLVETEIRGHGGDFRRLLWVVVIASKLAREAHNRLSSGDGFGADFSRKGPAWTRDER